jgi:hypothetical protein
MSLLEQHISNCSRERERERERERGGKTRKKKKERGILLESKTFIT